MSPVGADEVNVARETFRGLYGEPPDVVVKSPGRVNILGEHTDYIGGLCLPMAVNLSLYICGKRADEGVRIVSSLFPDPEPELVTTGSPGRYGLISSLLAELEECGKEFAGASVSVTGNLPASAGLSSSAALVMGTLTLLDALFEWGLSDDERIELSIRAEHRAGTPCGWMDPAVIVHGRAGHALFLDCYHRESEQVSLETMGYGWLVVHSGVERSLSEGKYAEIRSKMLAITGELSKFDERIEHPRQLSLEGYVELREKVSDGVQPCLDHYFLENERVKTFRLALSNRNFWQAGSLLFDAHESLRSNLGAGTPETDWIVETLAENKACIGARVTGAGFGGAVIALVSDSELDYLGITVSEEGRAKFNREMRSWRVEPSDGVKLVQNE